MKYEVPEINISKFSIENIVTASAVSVAEDAINQAVTDGTITGTAGSFVFQKTTMDEWVNW